MHEDHKTYIPGVGFLVTSWDGSESHIFKTPVEEDFDNDEEDFDDYDDSMDGDHDSAMESCGWGTDEDYGYYGEDF